MTTATMASEGVAAGRETEVAVGLWSSVLVRGITALFLGACGFLIAIPTPAALVRGVAIYWAVDGLCALWAGLLSGMVVFRRTPLVVRGALGIGGALLLAALPLLGLFGPYRPGQILAYLLTLPLVLSLILLQIVLVLVIDIPIGLEVRRRVRGEWSLLLAAVVSIVLSVLAAAGFLGLPFNMGTALGGVGLVGGALLVAGALRLRGSR